MFGSKLTDRVGRAQYLPGRNRPFGSFVVNAMYRCHAITVTLSSSGPALFALGCLMIVSLARYLNQTIRSQVIS